MKKQPEKKHWLWMTFLSGMILLALVSIVIALHLHRAQAPEIQVTCTHINKFSYLTQQGEDYQYRYWCTLTNVTNHPLPHGFVDLWVNDKQGNQLSKDCFWVYGFYTGNTLPAHADVPIYCDVNGHAVDNRGVTATHYFQYVVDTSQGQFVASGKGKITSPATLSPN